MLEDEVTEMLKAWVEEGDHARIQLFADLKVGTGEHEWRIPLAAVAGDLLIVVMYAPFDGCPAVAEVLPVEGSDDDVVCCSAGHTHCRLSPLPILLDFIEDDAVDLMGIVATDASRVFRKGPWYRSPWKVVELDIFSDYMRERGERNITNDPLILEGDAAIRTCLAWGGTRIA